ncbi:putative lipopolysaccharide heptosyltransferase III [Candidatus Magnetominusculus xianensis]|uniref:LPS heptosyltransferase III n=1 Tax=Candidatus Magnetominusculus xianensis TaxID=1748249 RepID=A0ABR5SEB0_9BACT|nr:putative lipopolysaccharide heptosyltransferase III [Candidatus Magnetominusculus xianensis]KWT84147.1 LPS heptosyltransferase III [Candidatus Magnetominusculus xianensis]MBF0402439.1 putative lipopolysaccharide heptosyltransferase III [Nitrospirota bacterium]
MNAEFDGITNILAVKLRHIGDVLLSAPVYRALRTAFPSARISALVNSGSEETLTGNPNIDEVIVFNRRLKELPVLKKYIGELRNLRAIRGRGFDMAIDMTGGDRGAIISYVSGARLRLAKDSGKASRWGKNYLYTHRALLDGYTHVVMQNMELLDKFSIKSIKSAKLAGYAVDMHIPEDVYSSVERLLKGRGIMDTDRYVHVHPTSRWFFKCWQDDRMAEVIDWLLNRGLKVVLTTAPDEKEIIKAKGILSLLEGRDGIVTLMGETSIKALGAISKGAAMFFGVDSAPMHIAAAMNTPVVALFGPSGAFNWGPWDNEKTISEPYARRNGIQTSGIHTVVQRDWDCIPCGGDGCNGTKKSRCLDDISAAEVKWLIEKRLS